MELALGYEDLNDHDVLRSDRLLNLIVGCKDVTEQDRRDEQDSGRPLARKSTLYQLQLIPPGASEESRYKKIVANIELIHNELIDLFIRLRSLQGTPEDLILNFDATDDPVTFSTIAYTLHYVLCVFRVERDGIRVGSGRHDPHTNPENRSSDQGHCPARLGETPGGASNTTNLRNNHL